MSNSARTWKMNLSEHLSEREAQDAMALAARRFPSAVGLKISHSPPDAYGDGEYWSLSCEFYKDTIPVDERDAMSAWRRAWRWLRFDAIRRPATYKEALYAHECAKYEYDCARLALADMAAVPPGEQYHVAREDRAVAEERVRVAEEKMRLTEAKLATASLNVEEVREYERALHDCE